jgi:DedD protein
MRTAFEDEEDELEAPAGRGHAHPDRELTVSATTLLAIFFGLVLVCGLFFGLGYSAGRRGQSDQSPLGTGSTASASEAYGTRPKPSAMPAGAVKPVSSGGGQVVEASEPTANSSSAAESSASQNADVAQLTQAGQTQPAASPALAPPTPAAAPAMPATAAAGTIMVQIAAISDQGDADVLTSALRKRGYQVVIRKEPGDSLMHVQVGPFANRADAMAMRQKLLGDGYNAIVK